MIRALQTIAVVTLGLVACTSQIPTESQWPPEDFYLDVRGFELRNGRSLQTQRFQVCADGLAIYRECDSTLSGVPFNVPLFDTVSVYRLHHASTRTLGRQLAQAGVFDAGARAVPDNSTPDGAHITISWRAMQASGQLTTRTLELSRVEQAVRIVNAFLPDGSAFRFEGQTSVRDPRRVSRVPAPSKDARGALRVHQEYLILGEDLGWELMEALALAIESGDRAASDALLKRLQNEGETLLQLDDDLPGYPLDEVIPILRARIDEIAAPR